MIKEPTDLEDTQEWQDLCEINLVNFNSNFSGFQGETYISKFEYHEWNKDKKEYVVYTVKIK